MERLDYALTQQGLSRYSMQPVHKGPILNDIFSKLKNVKYLSLIDAISGYHNLKLGKQSSYLTKLSSSIPYKFTVYHQIIYHTSHIVTWI